MQPVFRVADVREAESAAMTALGPDSLMQNAAFGLAVMCLQLLQESRGKVPGSRVSILVGTGNNGGDALWAGSLLAARGAAVVGIVVGEQYHQPGANALLTAGGRLLPSDHENVARIIEMSDLVLDGMLGIGGKGALRGEARKLAELANDASATVVAVDLPSGLDADTGAVEDRNAVVCADVTVTFGCLKVGLLVAPGTDFVGALHLVDIGLQPYLSSSSINVLDVSDVADRLPQPGEDDNKYSRGVVGVVAGSPPYPGAAVLCSGAARLGGTGMVRYAGGAPDVVAAHWPEVVLAADGPARAGRVQAWVIGPGGGTDRVARERLVEVLTCPDAAVVDADALTLLSEDADLRAMLAERHANGQVTILTPHEGEFARLGFTVGEGKNADRISSVVGAAGDLGAVVLLKGHHTVIADPNGAVFINTVSDSTLATAGSGDVLAGVLGSILASDVSLLTELGETNAAASAASAAFVHGTAGVLAGRADEPVTAMSVLEALPDAIATIRHDGSHG